MDDKNKQVSVSSIKVEKDDRNYTNTDKLVLIEILKRHDLAGSSLPEFRLKELMEEIEDKFNRLIDRLDG